MKSKILFILLAMVKYNFAFAENSLMTTTFIEINGVRYSQEKRLKSFSKNTQSISVATSSCQTVITDFDIGRLPVNSSIQFGIGYCGNIGSRNILSPSELSGSGKL